MLFRIGARMQYYDWGSTTLLASLQRRPVPTTRTEAELWWGTHPAAPSALLPAQPYATLRSLIAADGATHLGHATQAQFDGELPFLLKVLAIASPLSIQAHPNSHQARRGFDEETAAGIEVTSPNRTFKDRRHKPELLFSLQPTDLLCGFRQPSLTAKLLAETNVPRLLPLIERLRNSSEETALRDSFEWIVAQAVSERTATVEQLLHSAAVANPGTFWHQLGFAQLATRYPSDVGTLMATLLNCVHLESGQAIYVAAGVLHCYLRGFGVEVMANSDNVLRAGWTTKRVDIDRLRDIVEYRPQPPHLVEDASGASGVRTFSTPATEFELSRVALDGELAFATEQRCSIVLVTEGTCSVEVPEPQQQLLSLEGGEAAFVSAACPAITLRGRAVVFRVIPRGST